MPNNNNQPDINKAIDVCMEEYKTLRTEILQTIQNRTNVIVFGGALVLTLLGIGISPIANLPIMKKTTTITRIPTTTTTQTTKGEKKTTKGETTQTTISHPKGDSSHEIKPKNSKPTSSTLVIKEKDTATETISPQNFYATPIERRIPSAIILGIIVPASCGLIIFLVNASNHQVVRIGRYIATNIEPKINDLYFNNLPVAQKPIVWETYMQTLRFGPEEGYSVKSVFGTIQLLGLAGAVVAVLDIWIWITFIIVMLVLLLIPTKTKKIISPMYFSIFTEDSKEIAALRDGEGSLRKIWYKGIAQRNKDVKSTQIFWIKPIRYFIPLYQIVKSMIDDRDNAIIEIENDSLKSKLQTLDEFRLANQVQNTKVLMQAQGADKQDLLNELINNLFEHIQNQEVKSTRMYQIVESMIDDRDNAIIQIENGSLKSRLQTLGEVDLANQVESTRVSMQAQGADKQNLLNNLINYLFKNLLNKIKNYSRNPEYHPPFYLIDNGVRKRINNIPELLELCIDNPDKFKEHMEQGDFENWLDNIEIRETELANIAQATREKTFPNDNERLHYFLRECCLVLIGRNP
jgi:regulator of replication initiation timing